MEDLFHLRWSELFLVELEWDVHVCVDALENGKANCGVNVHKDGWESIADHENHYQNHDWVVNLIFETVDLAYDDVPDECVGDTDTNSD